MHNCRLKDGKNVTRSESHEGIQLEDLRRPFDNSIHCRRAMDLDTDSSSGYESTQIDDVATVL